jgi:uncharacterized protein YkwD
MVLSKRGWKKSLLVMVTLVLTLAATACTATPVNTATSSPLISTTPPTLPPTATTPIQTAVQTTPTTSSLSSPSPTPTTTTPPTPSSLTPEPATPTPEPPPPTLPIYTPTTTPYAPSTELAELYLYMLDLINLDRTAAGLNKVTLNYNAAAQEHAQDMLDKNYQAAHWGTDGKKPYMRYTDAGGLNYEQENSASYSSSNAIVVKEKLEQLQHTMMYDDAASNWSHRDNMLNKWHKKVNLGIAFNTNTVTLVQQFEGDYVQYSKPPAIKGKILSLTGHFLQPGFKLNNISIAYDALPQPISPALLTSDMQYHHYGLGQRLGLIFPPPPPGQVYQNLPPDSLIAQKGSFDYNGWFYIEADISQILSKGPGVYTVVLVALVGNEPVNVTNYTLFVK